MKNFFQAITTYLERVSNYDMLTVAVQLFMIAIAVWLIMRFLRGTRGARLVQGAAFMMAMVFIVFRLLPKTDEWRRLEFLYGKFLWFAAIAFVVSFQTEMRRGLISIGRARFFRGRQDELNELVDVLARSSSYLSRNKIGAIIAIERVVGLGALMENGTILDAQPSVDLINTIFFPNTALHDLGVIIHEGRIYAAGCQFPIAESEDVDHSMGSRHRAALGLARETDALVIVVSEETGRVTLAHDGQMDVGLEQDSLREMLLALLSVKAKRLAKPAKTAEGKSG